MSVVLPSTVGAMASPPSAQRHPGARLRALMDAGCTALPGAFNGLVARACAEAGFRGLYVSGAAVSASAGLPDVGLVGMEHFARIIREVSTASGLPVLADADTGFGEAEMVARTVWAYHEAGGAGLHIEDQSFPKRCGHLDGKSLIPTEHMVEKIRFAAVARDACSDGQFILCARTDAAGVEGVDAAIARAQAYVDAGADMIFPEGLRGDDDFLRVAQALRNDGSRKRVYLLANMTEFGKTPHIPVGRFAEMGYDVVIFPVTTLRVAMGAVTRALATLAQTGTAEGLLEGMQTRKELYDLLGYTPGQPWRYPHPPRPRE